MVILSILIKLGKAFIITNKKINLLTKSILVSCTAIFYGMNLIFESSNFDLNSLNETTYP